jgi:hypothetical protein
LNARLVFDPGFFLSQRHQAVSQKQAQESARPEDRTPLEHVQRIGHHNY